MLETVNLYFVSLNINTREEFAKSISIAKMKSTEEVVSLLEVALPNNVFGSGSLTYNTESRGTLHSHSSVVHKLTPQKALWNQAAWLSPTAIFIPSTPQDLSTGIQLLTSHHTPFAIRSGGHMPAPGHASTNTGILISTTKLNELTLVPTPNEHNVPYLRCGAGLTWGEIYAFLAPHNLFAIGGRVNAVGTSLILGGGMSYFSNAYGWAASNVVNFEVILASGGLVNANASSNADLFWALKGGSNNFGVVTRYDIRVYEATDMWGGMIAWGPESAGRFMGALEAFMEIGGGGEDVKGGTMVGIGVDAKGDVMTSTMLVYNDAVDAVPGAFKGFLDVGEPVFSSLGRQRFYEMLAPTAVYGTRDNRYVQILLYWE